MRDQIHHLVPAALLGLGCVMLFGAREQQQVAPRAPMATIQLDAPGYKTTDIVVDTNERRVAGMDDYVMRAFEPQAAATAAAPTASAVPDSTRADSTGAAALDAGFSVYVGYYTYQVQGKTIHSPKNCLPGGGWEPLESEPRVVSVGDTPVTVNRYLLANKGAQALVYYWYQGRGRVEYDEYKVKWYLLRDAAMFGRTEEALVRIVIPIDPARLRAQGPKATYAQADAQADALTRQLVPRVTQVLPTAPSA